MRVNEDIAAFFAVIALVLPVLGILTVSLAKPTDASQPVLVVMPPWQPTAESWGALAARGIDVLRP